MLPWVKEDVPGMNLQPLTPKFIPEQHRTYSDELVSLLRDRKRRKLVWNIALTGGYGSGKSSVLAAVRSRLHRRVVEVSLSSLSDVGVVSGEPGQDLNNYIQKEIVKQLLYRERPNRVPGSRFRRISRLPIWRTLLLSTAVATFASGLLWLTGWGAPFADPTLQPEQRVGLFVVIGAAVALITFVVQALFHNRVRVDKLGTGATSVSLASDATTSFFDEYLDEIVYFFEMTRRDVVIIEDLDRFEDPTIYASLRALNTVLNTSRQLRRRPVHFVYAVRDSIFEDLEVVQKAVEGETHTAGPTAETEKGVWQADRSRSDAPTQRTKFFDLVLPIVPFITHRNARDLLTDILREIDGAIPADVVRVVARHVTDMRLLRNMANEYRVFHKRVIEPGTLSGLTPRGLFGMVAYKNTHLNDFEQIRVGESSLDRLYRLSREVIDEGLESVAQEIAALESTPSPVASTVARAEQLGAMLQTCSIGGFRGLALPVFRHNCV